MRLIEVDGFSVTVTLDFIVVGMGDAVSVVAVAASEETTGVSLTPPLASVQG